MSSLSEFLLARISEDQADAMVGWRWKALPSGEYARLQARVLAECNTKRALVVMCQPDSIDAELRGLATTNPAAWELVGPLVEQSDEERRLTLAFLAFVYADHPDYRDEWKP